MLTVTMRSVLRSMLLLSLLFSSPLFAEEPVERPWGRLDKPALNAPQTHNHSGYLGRYNPWSKGSEGDSAPRYRNHDNANSRAATGAYTPYANTWVSPTQPYDPYGGGYPYGQSGGSPYSGYYPSPMQGLAPWSGGLNPDYGNYWNDPYDALGPNTGILWSDMWRR